MPPATVEELQAALSEERTKRKVAEDSLKKVMVERDEVVKSLSIIRAEQENVSTFGADGIDPESKAAKYLRWDYDQLVPPEGETKPAWTDWYATQREENPVIIAHKKKTEVQNETESVESTKTSPESVEPTKTAPGSKASVRPAPSSAKAPAPGNPPGRTALDHRAVSHMTKEQFAEAQKTAISMLRGGASVEPNE